ncbi:hypothetical protein M9H77_20604 [Catharanthus roseus]|uniref:Uncharacterized protein n=1 Tax=Catharanthus roseus TaxID=4058 RepID=A0ACC0AL07_CATRO|nr:hypothetical protein M9H77_20604 [Catharanthus roseus]
MALAELVLAPLLEVVLDKLANPVVQKMAEFWEFDDRFKKLKQVLPMVRAVLEDADKQQATNKAVRVWLSELKEAARKAEDLLEEITYKGTYSGRYSINCSETRNIFDLLQKAAIQGLNLQLTEKNIVDLQSERRETSSFILGSEVYGREEDKKRIIELLISSSSGGNVSGVSIIGVPGIGKTALAQLAYNSEEVKTHFDLRIWVFVSHEFRAKNIIKTAIESANGKKCEFSQLDMLHSKLWDVLCKKRYLIVLDDVWNCEQDSWDMLKPMFVGGVDGSKILVTTRDQKVAMSMEFPNKSYHLKGLPEDASWDLFRRQAFHQGQEEDKFQNLLAIGREITRKCLGVPLAVKIIASLLRFKREEGEWLDVQKSDLWNLQGYRRRILTAVELSYLHLPSCLKHCFAFCSTFPLNYDINKEKLIHMWMAHDLIHSDGESRRPEDIGDEYFRELLRLSFFEDVKECNSACGAAYKVNEFFHKFAVHLTSNESIVLGEKTLTPQNLSKIHHASWITDFRSSEIPERLYQAKHLRTLLIFSDGMKEIPLNAFSSFVYLRVLHLSGCQAELPESASEIPESIDEVPSVTYRQTPRSSFPFLRYLDLSHSSFQKLPSAVSSICSLVTLDLLGCYNLKWLPGLGGITSLRHLNITGCEALIEMPNQIENLVHLQTLPIFVVPTRSAPGNPSPEYYRRRRPWRSPWNPASISDLENLNLHGELKIKHLDRVSDAEEAKAASLHRKEYLESIGLCWGSNGADLIMNPTTGNTLYRLQDKNRVTGTSQESVQEVTLRDQQLAGEVLASLQPHHNLKKLFVVGYPGFSFPLWQLPQVTVVELIKCSGCLSLPTLGHLPSLRTLRMEGMNSVTIISQEFYGEGVRVFFPSLHELSMRNFPALQEWSSPDGAETYPRLSKLILRNCPNLNSLPVFPSVQQLQLQGCNPMILKCLEQTTSLSTLEIAGIDELSYIPGGLLRKNCLLNHLKISSCPKLQSLGSEMAGLASLRSLTIRWCENLFSLPNGLQNLTALESLEISDCHSLRTFPENGIGGLKSLRVLSIENCSNLVYVNFGSENVTALEHFTIMYCPSLASFPDGSQHLPVLRTLNILSCPEIAFLPEGLKHATLLQRLEIRNCPKFTALPDWLDNLSSLRSLAISDCPSLTSLPVAIRRLASLQYISVQDCPDLHRRCQKDRVDWWKIAHVPHRYIFSTQPQQFSCASSSSI